MSVGMDPMLVTTVRNRPAVPMQDQELYCVAHHNFRTTAPEAHS